MAKAKNWAIVVGINAYEHIGQLRYANCDAAALRDFFHEAKFDRVFCFADGLQLAPARDQKSVQPRHGDLVNFLHYRCTSTFDRLSASDTCWFFFAGHGKRIRDCDYLLPQDYNSRLPDKTQLAISVNFVRETLLKSGAGNVILLLDACRTEGDRADGLGIGDKQPGAITFFSCERNQNAYEIEALKQGAFTAALLEGLRKRKVSDNCATVERLDAYLRRRVPELLCRYHPERPIQTPNTEVDPVQKRSLLLLPDMATESDIVMLKNQAYESETRNKDLELAKQLWLCIIAATNGKDEGAIYEHARITERISKSEKPSSPAMPLPQTPPASSPFDLPSPTSSSSPHPMRPRSRLYPEPRLNSDSVYSLPPSHPLYQREKIAPLSSYSTPFVRPTQPETSRFQRTVPWIRIIILGCLSSICGISLTMSSAPFLAWVAALSMTIVIELRITKYIAGWALRLTSAVIAFYCIAFLVIFALFFAGSFGWVWARDMFLFLNEILLSSLAKVWAWLWAEIQAGAWIMIWAMTLAWTGAIAKAGLIDFSGFRTLLILVITSSGLGLGYWVVKTVSGH